MVTKLSKCQTENGSLSSRCILSLRNEITLNGLYERNNDGLMDKYYKVIRIRFDSILKTTVELL